jgi:hypothetical protein
MMVMIQIQAFSILRIAVTYLTIHEPPNTQSLSRYGAVLIIVWDLLFRGPVQLIFNCEPFAFGLSHTSNSQKSSELQATDLFPPSIWVLKISVSAYRVLWVRLGNCTNSIFLEQVHPYLGI